jgi:monomeric isocitrate dehydrogenase
MVRNLRRKQCDLEANDKARTQLEKLSTKYFALHMFHNNQHVPVVVWNGVRDYANDLFPFLELTKDQMTYETGVLDILKAPPLISMVGGCNEGYGPGGAL